MLRKRERTGERFTCPVVAPILLQPQKPDTENSHREILILNLTKFHAFEWLYRKSEQMSSTCILLYTQKNFTLSSWLTRIPILCERKQNLSSLFCSGTLASGSLPRSGRKPKLKSPLPPLSPPPPSPPPHPPPPPPPPPTHTHTYTHTSVGRTGKGGEDGEGWGGRRRVGRTGKGGEDGER